MYKTCRLIEFFRFSLLCGLILYLAGCANVVAPQGGPVDEDPPVVIRSEPPNFSTNYDGSDIRIFFDEFIRLHNLRQTMLVSPPLEDMPEVRVRRRSIIMSINEALSDSTTYNFFFGDAIRDITEGNAIPNFQFVVSTGDYVDSLSVRGEVLNAFDNKPVEGVYVMMYDNIYDSVPYKERPVYLSRTDSEGRFEINNMRKNEYLMFALKDQNFNYIFDQPDEKIAFLDSLIVPEFVYIHQPSDLDKDDGINGEKSIIETEETTDSTAEPESNEYHAEPEFTIDETTDTVFVEKKEDITFYRMYLFQEEDTVQRISSVNFEHPGKLTIALRIPFDSVYVEEYKNPFDRNWKIKEFSTNKDSVFLWLDNVDRDSLFLKVWDGKNLIDTVKRSIKPRVDDRRTTVDEPKLTLKTNHGTGNIFPYYKNLKITASNPIKKLDASRIKILINDSIPVESTWERFGMAERKFRFNKSFVQDTTYSFLIPDSTFRDIYGLYNKDTLSVSFNTSSEENYGKIMLNLTLPKKGNFILQLMDGNKNLLQEKLLESSGEYIFEHLSPRDYMFKLIHDKNNNGKWDTGNYLKGLQPEPVFILDEKITVRQNWEHEVIWDILQ